RHGAFRLRTRRPRHPQGEEMELTICEKWTLYVKPPTEKWFLDYVLRAPRDAGMHLTGSWHSYSLVRDMGIEVGSAVEYFGGIGGQALMIEELFSPTSHLVMDYSQEAVDHLQAQLTDVTVRQADSYDPATAAPADLV